MLTILGTHAQCFGGKIRSLILPLRHWTTTMCQATVKFKHSQTFCSKIKFYVMHTKAHIGDATGTQALHPVCMMFRGAQGSLVRPCFDPYNQMQL